MVIIMYKLFINFVRLISFDLSRCLSSRILSICLLSSPMVSSPLFFSLLYSSCFFMSVTSPLVRFFFFFLGYSQFVSPPLYSSCLLCSPFISSSCDSSLLVSSQTVYFPFTHIGSSPLLSYHLLSTRLSSRLLKSRFISFRNLSTPFLPFLLVSFPLLQSSIALSPLVSSHNKARIDISRFIRVHHHSTKITKSNYNYYLIT